MGVLTNIEVYTINEWLEYHRSYMPNNEILVDDIELILGDALSKFLNANVTTGNILDN